MPPAFDRFACRLERHRKREISMTQHRHHTAPTQFVDAAGVRFAYRRFGHMANGTKTAPTFRDAVRMHKLIDAAMESSKTGRRVSVA
jgi:predicted dehydrogenase